MAKIAAPMGSSFEVLLPMTNTLTISDAATNIVIGTSGLSGGKNLTLPAISQMVASQNQGLLIVNASGSGGTITCVPNAADESTIIGASTCATSHGLTLYHDGISQWYGIA